MFVGTYSPKLDEKGRIFLPAKFRDELKDGLVIVPFHDDCLALYPVATFERKAQEIADLPESFVQVREYQRWLANEASLDVPDKQYRVHIPSRLREYAGLDGQILARGSIVRVELWNPQRWDEHSAKQPRAYPDMDSAVRPKDLPA